MPRKHSSPYDHNWRRLRPIILARDGHQCYWPGCTTRATTVDHIIPVTEAPHLRLEPSNLRASCVKHNSGRSFRRIAQIARINRQPARVRDW